MLARIGVLVHRQAKGHDPEWFVIAYDRGHAIWKCKVCDLGRPFAAMVMKGV